MDENDNNCLLSYQISTDPSPMQVSLQRGNPSYTSITITVSNNTVSHIYCNEIKFSIPVGLLAQSLTENTNGILVTSSSNDKWKISNNNDGSFTATSSKPENNCISDKGLVFRIYNINVNKEVGEFTFSVNEISSNDKHNFTNKQKIYSFGKFPYGFYMKNFTSNLPLVQNGSAVVITWAASDSAVYTMIFGDKSVDVTHTRSWTSPPINNVTTFILKGTVQHLGETVSSYLSTTVVVANPEITASKLNVLQKCNINGDTTIGTDAGSAVLHVKGNQTVDKVFNASEINASKLNVSKQCNINGDTTIRSDAGSTALHVIGAQIVDKAFTANEINTSKLNVSQQCNIIGDTTIGTDAGSATLRVKGDQTVNKSLTADSIKTNLLQNIPGKELFFVDSDGRKWSWKFTNENLSMRIQYCLWSSLPIDFKHSMIWYGLKLEPGSYKTFVIDHPIRPDHYLVHATLEGPEAAIFYRGKSQLIRGKAVIKLPDYAVALAIPESWTVTLTPINGFDLISVEMNNNLVVLNGAFSVISDNDDSNQAFFWEAKAARNDGVPLTVEPKKDEMDVGGFGPYTFGIPK